MIIILPEKEYIYIFGRQFPEYPGIKIINYSIVFGKFEIIFDVADVERHLQKVEIYIDEEEVYEQEFINSWWDFIRWNCNKFIIGMHEIKIVAIDSYNNSAMEKFNCFIINFI